MSMRTKAVMQKKKKSVAYKYMIMGFVFLIPAIAVYLIFMGYPLWRTFYLSTTQWTGFGEATFVGFDNFVNLFKDKMFWDSLKNTLYFAVFSSIFSVIIGLVLAWLNMYMRRMEGQVFRTIMFSPAMIAPTITGLLFVFIFTEDIGLLNNLLRAMGVPDLATAWLTNISTAKPIIVIATIWRQFGLTMVLCYAGMQGVSNEILESAKLDGANHLQVFTRILIPLIKPQIEIATMFTMLGGLRIYDSVVALTAGGPARQTVVLPMWIIENAFTYSKFGYASAMSVVFVFVVLICIGILRLVFRGGDA
jgi:ABC-type sugar transport systems, permease components